MPEKILLVDDDPSILHLLNGYFTQLGWSVQTSETAVKLEKMIDTFVPDVVLCDLCVPDRDAVGFLLDRVALGADNLVRQTPVVVMSAHDFVDDALDIDLEVAAVIRKPIDLSALGEQIESLVTGRQGAATP